MRTAIDETRRTRRVIVAPDDRPQGEPPIFIVGAHRSGTTLVRLIADSHSHIACPPESFFLLPLAGVLGDEKSVEGLEAMGFSEDHVVRHLRESASYFFEMYAASREKPRWADKTPPYVDCLDFIEKLYGPDCRYVLVLRHGLDTACSLVDVTPREVTPHIEACGGDRHAGGARYWAAQCEKMLEFRDRHPERCFELRYEALTSEPEATLRPLFDFLGEPWEPAVLRFHEQPHDRWIGLEDRKASEAQGFAPNSGRYLRESPETIERMCEQAGPMLDRLGYTVEKSGTRGS
ncbi:MAG: sulfotransferase family protein [Myxococcota bacterium]